MYKVQYYHCNSLPHPRGPAFGGTGWIRVNHHKNPSLFHSAWVLPTPKAPLATTALLAMLADSSTSVSLCGPGQHEEQVLVRAVNSEVWLKPQMSPRMWASKEKQLKFSLMANSAWSYTSPDKSLNSVLHNISTENLCSLSRAGSGCSSCGLVGTFACGLGQARIGVVSTAPTVGPGAQPLQPWDLTSLGLCQWPGGKNT